MRAVNPTRTRAVGTVFRKFYRHQTQGTSQTKLASHLHSTRSIQICFRRLLVSGTPLVANFGRPGNMRVPRTPKNFYRS